LLRDPKATVEDVQISMTKHGVAPSTTCTIQTVNSNSRHTFKVLVDHFDGKVPAVENGDEDR
jgi:hypothetical protein